MNIMSFWLAKTHQQESVVDVTSCLNDVFPREVSRKAESSGNGALSSGEKNFSVHKTYMNFSRPRKRAPETALYTLRGLLPQNVPDTTQPDDDVYNLGTRRGRMLVDGALSGRSMVEMLGVLAIIGVLSVGAISGYQKAMFKYRLNKQTEQLNTVFNAVARHSSSFKNIQSSQNVTQYFTKLGEIPTEMFKTDSNNSIYDVFNNQIYIQSQPQSGSDTTQVPGVTVLYYKINLTLKSHDTIEICKNIFLLAQENRSSIYEIYSSSGYSTTDNRTFVAYGDNFCNSKQSCLKNLDLTTIQKACELHFNNQSNDGHFALLWKHI